MWLRCCSFMLPIFLEFFCYFFSLSLSALLRCSSMDILARLSCLTIYWFLWHFLQRLFQLILPFFWLSYTLSWNFPSIKLWEKSRRKPQRKVISFSPSLSLWLNLKILAYAVHARFTASPSPTHTHGDTLRRCGVSGCKTNKKGKQWVGTCRCVCMSLCVRACVCVS